MVINKYGDEHMKALMKTIILALFLLTGVSYGQDSIQLSQITLLGIPAGGSIPKVRMLVQTEWNGGNYYGWEFVSNANDEYTAFTWFHGAPAINGRSNIDISQHNFNIRADLVLRTYVEYPEPTVAIVYAYAGTSEGTLIEIGNIEVHDGVGVIAKDGFPADGSVPFWPYGGGRYPGMLFHGNSSGTTERPLFKLFKDGYLFGSDEADMYVGIFDTPLATYDAQYRDARDGYYVQHLLLNGDGSVKMDGNYNGGFSYYREDVTDTIPSFSFTAVTNAELNTEYIGSAIFSEADSTFNVWTTTGAEFRINEGSYSTAMKTAGNGDNIDVKNTTGGLYEEPYTETIVAGGYSRNFVVTTKAEPADTLGPELIFNGDMEFNTFWAAAWQPDSCLQSADIAYGGDYSWKTVTGFGSGIASSYTPPQLEVIEDSTYWVDAYIYIVTGGARLVVFTDTYNQMWSSAVTGEWLHVSFSFVAENLTEPGLAYLYFLGNSGGTSTFYIDDVSVRQRITPSNQYIEVLTPNGGESWLAGSTQNILWLSTGITNVKLEYTTDNEASWETIVNSVPASSGSYGWTVPNSPSGNGKVKISNVENNSVFDKSDGIFEIYLMQFEVQPNWNMISLPVLNENMTKTFLFPNAVSHAFGYNNIYVLSDTLENGFGYWLRFDSTETISLQGNELNSYNINVVNGWNMIGPFHFNVVVSNISTTPPNLITSDFFGYNELGYQITDTLKMGKGYWVKTNLNGMLHLNELLNTVYSNNTVPNQALIEIYFTITDGAGGTRILIAGTDSTGTDGLDSWLGEYEIPPLPPAGVFDARLNLSDSTISTIKDIRQGTDQGGFEREHQIQYQIGDGTEIIINYDFGSYPPEQIRGRLQDIVTGELIDTTISGIGSFNVPNPAIFNKLKLTMIYDAPIPVELNSFTAKSRSNIVELNWSTITEINNSGFSIERKSKNESDWQTVGFVKGRGTVTEQTNYSFSDKNLITGFYYYRLKQIDFNGTFEYSKTVEVEVSIPKQFALEQNYPNPFNPASTISFDVPMQSDVLLRVYDMLGNEVATLVNEEKSAGRYEVSFNAVGLASGVYIFRLIAGAFVETKKMVLLR